ncbi:MurR/RpiR family transcriptional regulator [Pseudonocardia thermophila]|jgi:Transcriptional regulators|uniref:MurR/RpiR family transcriptional regulator n=1 Tax=Pseudonocardia thermophila TaxID=1848 RepID=UPI00248EE15B|nr:MurR/RpiR family transcriptional regulator [Pseudonocardia thermophila]
MDDRAIPPWLGGDEATQNLSPTMRRVAQAIAANPRRCSYAPVSEVAELAGTTPSTVVRYAQALGYRGWSALQQEVRAHYLAGLSTDQTRAEHTPAGATAPVHDAVRRDIANLNLALELVDPDVVDAAAATMANARTTLVVASGSFAAPAHVLTHLACVMGLPFQFEGRGGVHLASASGRLGPQDCLVAISFWKQFREIAVLTETLRDAGVPIVVVTDAATTRLSAAATHLITVPSEGVSFFQSVTAATSVVYGLLATIEQHLAADARAAHQRTQELWTALEVWDDRG